MEEVWGTSAAGDDGQLRRLFVLFGGRKGRTNVVRSDVRRCVSFRETNRQETRTTSRSSSCTSPSDRPFSERKRLLDS